MLQIKDKMGVRMLLSAAQFKHVPEFDLPVCNVHYGVDISFAISEHNPEKGLYPRVYGGVHKFTGQKVCTSYWLPFNAHAVDTKTGRQFEIARIKRHEDWMRDAIYPTFAVKLNGTTVAYIIGECYNKD